ncbi:FGGY-family carbohydrate kinase [Pseudothermotoga sp.]
MEDKGFILSVDQSTATTKVFLFDSKLSLVARAAKSHKQYYPMPGWVEHDPREIVKRTYEACREVLHNVPKDNVLAVSITNQRETIVVWDGSGKPLYNAVVWQCQRGKEICESLKNKGYADIVRDKTGLLLDPYFSASKIAWLVKNVKEVKEKLLEGDLYVGTIDSWLVWNLTKGKAHVTDYSNASRTLLLNINTLKWDEELTDIFEISGIRLPALVDSDSVVGYTDLDGVLPHAIPILGVMGDSSAALYGQLGFKLGDTKATYGTGTSIMMNVKNFKPKLKSGVLSIGWSQGGEIDFVAEGNIHSSGDTIKWLVEQMELASSAEEVEKLAASVDNNDGVYFVPAFVGLGAPYWENDARALICGMSRRTNKSHIARAAIESIAYQVHDLFVALCEEAHVMPRELKADGGATKNAFLMQFQANVLNVPVTVSKFEDCSALGVALLAARRLGLMAPSEFQLERMYYYPSMDEAKRRELIRGWREAVQRTVLRVRGEQHG